MSSCIPLQVLLTVVDKFFKANDNDELADEISYWSLIGPLLFPAKQTRPDILYDVNAH